jgi:ABC-type transport system involved in cytochrome c biogenesis ATPase subunit
MTRLAAHWHRSIMPSTQAPEGQGVVETRALTKIYPGDVTALDGLTVSVAPGVTGLVGANGAGKSTLIKILLGLIPPTRGQAKVLGHDCETSGERIRMLLGYMPEHDCLPPDVTATEFVTHLGRMSGLPPTVAKERAAESLRHVGLHEERYRLIGTYSTGMKQRVKLAGWSSDGTRSKSCSATRRRCRMSETQAVGVIHDLGYRRYDGPRLGRVQIIRALIWHSFRSSWGIGRGVKAKIVPILAARSTGSSRSCSSRPASGAWPRDTGR